MAELSTPLTNTEGVKNLPEQQRKAIAVEALGNLNNQQQQDAVQQSGMSRPGQGATNALWIALVVALSLLALVAGVAIVITGDMNNKFTVFITAGGALIVIFILSLIQARR